MKFYIEIQEEKIVSKIALNEHLDIDGFVEVSEEIYNQIKTPSTFEIDGNGNLFNFNFIGKEFEVGDEENEVVLLKQQLEEQQQKIRGLQEMMNAMLGVDE